MLLFYDPYKLCSSKKVCMCAKGLTATAMEHAVNLSKNIILTLTGHIFQFDVAVLTLSFVFNLAPINKKKDNFSFMMSRQFQLCCILTMNSYD